MHHALDRKENIFDELNPSVLQSIINDLDTSRKWRELVAIAGQDDKRFALR